MDTPALLIIDMVKDNFDPQKPLPITPFAQAVIEPINTLAAFFRENTWPVVFATDAFNAGDFIFKGRMQPHSLAGTPGAEIVESLVREATDYWLPKPRFSAFFNTGLDQWLRARRVDLCAVCGIATNFCVLTTVMDALCHDFKAVFVADACAAATAELHQATLSLYRRNPLYPLLQVMTAAQLTNVLKG